WHAICTVHQLQRSNTFTHWRRCCHLIDLLMSNKKMGARVMDWNIYKELHRATRILKSRADFLDIEYKGKAYNCECIRGSILAVYMVTIHFIAAFYLKSRCDTEIIYTFSN